jgi:hypothetical protein
MRRTLRHLLIALALLFGQQVAQVHALTHLERAAACGQREGKITCSGGHPAAQCLAFHAVDSALPVVAPALALSGVAPPSPADFTLPLPLSPRIEFDSRAPPGLLS